MIVSIIVFITFFQRLQKFMENQIAEQVVHSEILLASTAGAQINNIFETAKKELISLAKSFPMQNLISAFETKNEEQVEYWRAPLTQQFLAVAENFRFINQVRFIDLNGQEIIRVDRKNNGVVEQTNVLQNKSNEFYFSQAISLEANQFYLSPVTLNREFGKTAIPMREVIRLVTPVMYHKQKKGIVILNIDMDSIHDIIDTLSQHAWLFNNSGELLNCSMGLAQIEHEKEMELIFQQPKKTYRLPLDFYHKSGERSIIAFFPIDVVDQKWYVVSEQPFEEISNIMLQSNKIRNILFAIIMVSFAGILIFFYKLYADQQKAELKAEMAEGLLHLNKQLEKKSNELEKANFSLEEIDKRKTDFLNMVAHDLRTPLTSICSYSDLLLRYSNHPAKTKNEFAEIIKKESIRLSSLIDNFLDISKIEAGEIEYKQESLNITELIDHFVKLFQGEGKVHHIKITTEVEKNLPLIKGDKERLGQVFSNLLSNAMKFTPPKGSVGIKASQFTVKGNGFQTPYIQVSIEDTGIGIPADSVGKIFDKFVQLNYRDIKPTRGTGLGLTITKEIIEQHGGTITVESEENKGSKFIFTLKASGKQSAVSNKQ